jgi:hypothetical protein
MKPKTANTGKKRAKKILAIFKEMVEEKRIITDHLENGGKWSELKLNKKRLVKVV